MLAKGRSEMRQDNQEFGVLDADGLTLGIETRPWDEAMHVRVKEEPLVPCVESCGETGDDGLKPLVGSERVAQRRGDRGKEEVEGFLGLVTKETGS